jgi:hypothetical protein
MLVKDLSYRQGCKYNHAAFDRSVFFAVCVPYKQLAQSDEVVVACGDRSLEAIKSEGMCDSFFGEGKAGVKSGVQVTLQMTYRRNPSLPLRAFQSHPSHWDGIKKIKKSSESLSCLHKQLAKSNAAVVVCEDANYGNRGALQKTGTTKLVKRHSSFSARLLYVVTYSSDIYDAIVCSLLWIPKFLTC